MYKNVFFDLDGTLLETVTDIAIAINEALDKAGLPYRYEREEVIRMIGNGAKVLIRKAMGQYADDESLFLEVERLYMPLYRKYQNDHAEPFEGMIETLNRLKKEGTNLYVVTNKPHGLAVYIVSYHFPGIFKEILGQKEGTPLKPDPYQVDEILDRHNGKREESLYVGDSIVDIETGHNAGMKVALCTYGYGKYDEATLSLADYLLERPVDLIDVVLN